MERVQDLVMILRRTCGNLLIRIGQQFTEINPCISIPFTQELKAGFLESLRTVEKNGKEIRVLQFFCKICFPAMQGDNLHLRTVKAQFVRHIVSGGNPGNPLHLVVRFQNSVYRTGTGKDADIPGLKECDLPAVRMLVQVCRDLIRLIAFKVYRLGGRIAFCGSSSIYCGNRLPRSKRSFCSISIC